ncbi:hypothetical protein [Alcanivorax sp.]|uniref:hypothetical protein n=1 Tax=Alcanivorax sp. TaxID=1872427 RepID=UPI0026325A88|nr:hypothetical protein [Alcanivorax sp.]
MATNTETAVIQALLQRQRPGLLGQPAFAGFESEDAILAAFVDRRLTAQQNRAVKQVLAADPLLRQQWQAVLSAQTRESAAGGAKRSPWLALGGVGMAASLAFAAVLIWSGMELEQQGPSLAQQEPLAPAQVKPAPDYAAQAVPIPAWEAFLMAYEGNESSASLVDKTSQAFAELAGHLRTLESTACQGTDAPGAEQLVSAQSVWVPLADRFDKELAPLTPQNNAGWCQVGETLRQTAQRAVTDNNSQ